MERLGPVVAVTAGLGTVRALSSAEMRLQAEEEELEVRVRAADVGIAELRGAFAVGEELYFEATRQNLSGDMELWARTLAKTKSGTGVVSFLSTTQALLRSGDEEVRLDLSRLMRDRKGAGLSPRILPQLLRLGDELSFTARAAVGSARLGAPLRSARLQAERVELPGMGLEGEWRLGVVQSTQDGWVIVYSKPIGRVVLRPNSWCTDSSRTPLGLRLRMHVRNLPQPVMSSFPFLAVRTAPQHSPFKGCRWEGLEVSVANEIKLRFQAENKGGFGNPGTIDQTNASPVDDLTTRVNGVRMRDGAGGDEGLLYTKRDIHTTFGRPYQFAIDRSSSSQQRLRSNQVQQTNTGDYAFLNVSPSPPTEEECEQPPDLAPSPALDFEVVDEEFPSLGLAGGGRAAGLSRQGVKRLEEASPPTSAGVAEWLSGISVPDIEADAAAAPLPPPPPPGFPPIPAEDQLRRRQLGRFKMGMAALVDSLLADECLFTLATQNGKKKLADAISEYYSQ